MKEVTRVAVPQSTYCPYIFFGQLLVFCTADKLNILDLFAPATTVVDIPFRGPMAGKSYFCDFHRYELNILMFYTRTAREWVPSKLLKVAIKSD